MIWEEVITEDPLTVAVWEEDPDSEDDIDTWVHIYRNGIRMFEYLLPEEANRIIREIQSLEEERLGGFGVPDGF